MRLSIWMVTSCSVRDVIRHRKRISAIVPKLKEIFLRQTSLRCDLRCDELSLDLCQETGVAESIQDVISGLWHPSADFSRVYKIMPCIRILTPNFLMSGNRSCWINMWRHFGFNASYRTFSQIYIKCKMSRFWRKLSFQNIINSFYLWREISI